MDVVRVTRSLDPEMVEAAYREGIFPMAASEWGIITWHRPRRRGVLPLEGFHLARSLDRTLRQRRFDVAFNRDFEGTMRACAEGRETWISAEFVRVYSELHRAGKAHSVEILVDGALAGGLYGVQLGGAFFAESKFHRARDMSKVALAQLVFRLRERGFGLLDVQYLTPHLAQFGIIEIPDRLYRQRLAFALELDCRFP
ncbi:MAG: leucyl/phenylalanyl-tRNA--protein transferase [Bryobacter sp.]|nr:leucyl/phenylalanyl-tRNA--protein transferase [Bryobacter sp.]